MNTTFNAFACQSYNDKGKAKVHAVYSDFDLVYGDDYDFYNEEEALRRAMAESKAQYHYQDYHVNKESGSSTGPGTISRSEVDKQRAVKTSPTCAQSHSSQSHSIQDCNGKLNTQPVNDHSATPAPGQSSQRTNDSGNSEKVAQCAPAPAIPHLDIMQDNLPKPDNTDAPVAPVESTGSYESLDKRSLDESITPSGHSSDEDDLEEVVISYVSPEQQTAALKLHTQRAASPIRLEFAPFEITIESLTSKMSSLEAGDSPPEQFNYSKDDRSSRRSSRGSGESSDGSASSSSTRTLKRRAPDSDAEDEQNTPANAGGTHPMARYSPRRRLNSLETVAHGQEHVNAPESVDRAPSKADEAEQTHDKVEEKQAQSSHVVHVDIAGQRPPVELVSELAISHAPQVHDEEVPQEMAAAAPESQHAQQQECEVIRNEPLQATQQSLESSPGVICGSTPEIPEHQELPLPALSTSEVSAYLAHTLANESAAQILIDLKYSQIQSAPSQDHKMLDDVQVCQPLPAETYDPKQHFYTPLVSAGDFQMDVVAVEVQEKIAVDVLMSFQTSRAPPREDHQMSNVNLQVPHQTPTVEEYNPRQPYFQIPLGSASQSIAVMETQEGTAEVHVGTAPAGAMEEIEDEMVQAEEVEDGPTFTPMHVHEEPLVEHAMHQIAAPLPSSDVHVINEDEGMLATIEISAENSAAASMWMNMGAAVMGQLSAFAEWNSNLAQSLCRHVLRSEEDIDMGTSVDDMVEQLIKKFEQLKLDTPSTSTAAITVVVPPVDSQPPCEQRNAEPKEHKLVATTNEQSPVLCERRRKHRYSAEPYQCLDTIARREAKRKAAAKKLNICHPKSVRTQKSSAAAAAVSSLPVNVSPDAPIHNSEYAPVFKTVLEAPIANSDDAPSTAASPGLSRSEATAQDHAALTTAPILSPPHRTSPTHAAPAAHISSFSSLSYGQSNAPISSGLPAPRVNNGNQTPSTTTAAATSSLPLPLPNSPPQASNSPSTSVPNPVPSSLVPAAPDSTAVDARTLDISMTGERRLDEHDDARVMPGHYALVHSYNGYMDAEESWGYPVGLLSLAAVVLTAAVYVR